MSFAARVASVNRVAINSLLFLSSFAPLFLLLAIRFGTMALRIASGALALIGFAGLLVVLRTGSARKTSETVTPLALDDKGADVSGYLAAYLMPLLVLPDPSLADGLAYALFLLVAGVVYARSRMLQINPTLYLFSYRVFLISQSQEGFQGYIISRGELTAGAPLSVARLRDNLLLDVR